MKAYSHRFLIATGPQAFARYTVPDGKRAIVKQLQVANSQSEASYTWVFAASAPVLFAEFQAQRGGLSMETRLVLYPHEVLEVQTSSSSIWVTATGYLFDDDSGALAAEGEVDHGFLTDAEQLPRL